MDIKRFCTAETPLQVGDVEVVDEAVGEKTGRNCTPQETLPILPSAPYQPRDVGCIQVQRLAKRTLSFQRTWFESYPWLHFDADLGGVLCFTCAKAASLDLAGMARCSEETFISKGFFNWKKAIEKFKNHQKTSAHMISHSNLRFRSSSTDVDAQLSAHHLEEQRKARNSLMKIVTTLQYLAQQGLAIRGKEASDGNFAKLLELRSGDDDVLKRWLTRITSYTSVATQNKLLKVMAHMVLRGICKNVGHFGVIVDGTQDVQGVEQEAICVRYVDAYNVHEDFLGLYSVSETTGASLSNMLQDALLRLNLPMTHMRAQTYDGVSNMSGKYQGCQALIKTVQPLAHYTHCGAHITHLICAKATESAPFLRDALNVVQELGVFYNASGKFKKVYLDQHVTDDNPAPSSLKPLCPTRWLSRGVAIRAVLSNFADVLGALDEASSTFGSSTAARANVIHCLMASAKCVLGLMASLPVIECLENFNTVLQSAETTVAGMLAAASVVRNNLPLLRRDIDMEFHAIFEAATDKTQQLNIEPLSLPRQREIPRRHDDGDEPHTHTSAEQYFRVQFLAAVDSVLANIDAFFTSTDLTSYKQLSDMLTSGVVDEDVVSRYPELSESLQQELTFFCRQYEHSSVDKVRLTFRDMVPEVRKLFPQVSTLLRLLLVSPASSCSAERSFSALRRMKTWLRSTMTLQRLNHVMVCHVHRTRLAECSPRDIAAEFVDNSSDTRRSVFGRF